MKPGRDSASCIRHDNDPCMPFVCFLKTLASDSYSLLQSYCHAFVKDLFSYLCEIDAGAGQMTGHVLVLLLCPPKKENVESITEHLSLPISVCCKRA